MFKNRKNRERKKQERETRNPVMKTNTVIICLYSSSAKPLLLFSVICRVTNTKQTPLHILHPYPSPPPRSVDIQINIHTQIHIYVCVCV